MSLQFLSFLLGFLLGIIITFLLQRILRRQRFNNPDRKNKLANLRTVRTWMESYRSLFDAVYPECPELILAHKMLSPEYPYYDKTGPLKLYEALKEYRRLQERHDQLTRQAEASLEGLTDKNLDRLYGLNKKASGLLQRLGLLKERLLLPVSFPTDIREHLKVIDQYRQKVFEEFPSKVVGEIEWEKLEHVPPEQLSTIVHPELPYFLANEDISRDREKESKLFDEMQNLSFYRIVAKKEIDQILAKIARLEERYT